MGSRRRRCIGIAIAIILPVVAVGADAPEREDEAKARKALVRQGARSWSAYCGSCHNARPPGERSPEEWDTLLLHMRVRANLPDRDARALLEYLKSR